MAIHSYITIAQHSSNDTAYQANEKNAAFDTPLSSKTKKKMLIKHDSIVKCTDVNNHREEDSGIMTTGGLITKITMTAAT